MSLFFTKAVSYLIFPLSLGLLIAVLGLVAVSWWRRLGCTLIFLGLAIIWIPALPPVSKSLRGSLENLYPPQAVNAVPAAQAIVVLGGGTGAAIAPRLYPDLKSGADRVIHAARLYLAGKAPLILASGGHVEWRLNDQSEASGMQQILVEQGVPASAIVLETQSRNTAENARSTYQLLQARGIDSILLVTSALHMRRAYRVFQSTGLQVTPVATDHEVVDKGNRTFLRWLPQVDDLEGSTRAIKEYVGYWAYVWRGYIQAEQADQYGPNEPSAFTPPS